MQGRNLVSLPLKRSRHRSAHITTLTILKRCEFQQNLLRSGILAVDSAARLNEVAFFIRGAPSSIAQVLGRSSIPDAYYQVTEAHCSWLLPVLSMPSKH